MSCTGSSFNQSDEGLKGFSARAFANVRMSECVGPEICTLLVLSKFLVYIVLIQVMRA